MRRETRKAGACGFDGRDVARQTCKRRTQVATRFAENPPVFTVRRRLLVALGLDPLQHPLVDGREALRTSSASRAEQVDDHTPRGGLGQVLAIAVRADMLFQALDFPSRACGFFGRDDEAGANRASLRDLSRFRLPATAVLPKHRRRWSGRRGCVLSAHRPRDRRSRRGRLPVRPHVQQIAVRRRSRRRSWRCARRRRRRHRPTGGREWRSQRQTTVIPAQRPVWSHGAAGFRSAGTTVAGALRARGG